MRLPFRARDEHGGRIALGQDGSPGVGRLEWGIGDGPVMVLVGSDVVARELSGAGRRNGNGAVQVERQ